MTAAESITADVHFERKAADESYGNETVGITLHAVPEALIASALANVRGLVHAELARSPSPRVRHAVDYPRTVSETAGVASDTADLEDLPF